MSLPPHEKSPASSAALAALVAGAVAMGASPILVRLAEVGPFASAFWRVSLALPVLWAWARLEARGRPKTESRPVSRAALLAGALFAGDLFFWHLAVTHTTVANATFFATTAPVWVVLAAWLMRSEHVGRRTLGGLGLAVLGGSMLVAESMEVDPSRISGDIFGLTTAIFFGGYFLAVRAARQEEGPARITFVASIVTALILGAIAFMLEPTFIPASGTGVGALVGLALVSHAAGQGLLAYALGHLPAVFSSLVIFLEAIAAAALGVLVLGEMLSTLQIAGGVLILAAVMIARPSSSAAG
ncbi:DMT family transporter [Terrihabitans rhizophilus]|uniref:DMT family transporter n=1 Tax=Terrihabitans rhizophilus TaxID=3092662 RepID=A0ABU4RPA2_9HYPH|nr:DMT family transporter [Terrihabitans sp. PJ23]MDX6806675.1 DMT family transporter [Terrihabitans sp. PJ23]